MESRGPYRKYLSDPDCPVPRTTQWRSRKNVDISSGCDSVVLDDPVSNSEGEMGANCTSGFAENEYDHDSDDDVSHGDDSCDGDNDSGSDDDDGCALSDDGCALSDDGCALSDDGCALSDDDCDDMLSEGDSSEDSVHCDDPHMSEPIYEGSQVTVQEAYCLLMELKRVCKLSFATMVTVLSLLQILCPAGNLLPTSKHQLLKFACRFASKHSRIDYCRSCGCELPKKLRCQSDSCRKEEPNSILLISPTQTIKRIVTRNWEKVCTHSLTLKGTIGVTINTDGISPFKSSRLTVWPIFLSLWNLPPRVRMLKQNIVTCMFWIGNTKPNMRIFLRLLGKLLEEVNLKVPTPQGVQSFELKPILGVFDMVAKAPILNMNQFNGRYGCPSCVHPGKGVDFKQIYPPDNLYPLRTAESLQECARQAETSGVIVKGVKGTSVISSMLEIPLGVPVDYMHCVLEGVVKRLLDKWVTSPNQPFYIRKQSLKLLDQSFVIQQPPHEFTRVPRSIEKHRNYWKASEFRTWLLFYSLPLLLSFLPPLYITFIILHFLCVHFTSFYNQTSHKSKSMQLMLC